MLRNVGAVFVGMFVGGVLNMAIIMANMALFPAPEGLDFNDAVAMADYIASLPQAGFILPWVAHLTQALVGGWIAARLGASRPVLLAMIVAVLTMLGGVANMLQYAGPWWMYSEFPLYLAAGWAAGTVEQRRRDSLPTA